MELELEDAFAGDVLDERRWIPRYLPQWSSGADAAARYDVGGGRLRLRIDHDQAPWCPEWDGDVRVSSLQTGVFAGPLGSAIGQHRFHPGAVVREEQAERWLYTPHHALIEVRMTALPDPDCMVALWMIGVEDAPERSAEICVCEIFGRDVTPEHVAFSVDGAHVKTVRQSPGYPMQLMLGIYEFAAAERDPAAYPKAFDVDYVRGYRAARS